MPLSNALSIPTDAYQEDLHFHSTDNRSPHRYLWALLFLTLIGAVLRFAAIGRPTFWIDEAFTYWRVTGTYGDLLGILREDGFTPLHYELYWLIAQVTKLSPFFMRIVPATAGTLMIPAMYFLARQVGSRKLALLAAAFATCSAYQLNYSHDAKMYMDTWLFMTLHIGCLIWWLRTRLLFAWLGWIAAGLAMGGTHGTYLIVLAIEPFMVLSAPRFRWTTMLIFLAGLALIASGPAGYYLYFNQWGDRIETRGWRSASGLGWVDWFNAGREGIDKLRYPATAYLFNWEWTRDQSEPNVNPRVLFWCKTAATAVLIFAVMGLFPWETLRRRMRKVTSPIPFSGDESSLRRPTDEAYESWWRNSFWIAIWICFPAFIIHFISSGQPVSPLTLLQSASQYLDSPIKWILLIAISLAAISMSGATGREQALKAFQLAAVVGAIYGICWGFASLFEVRNAGSVWVPRYLAIIWPAFAIGLCALLLRLPGRPFRASAITLVLSMNLANGIARMVYFTQPPLDRMATDFVTGRDENSTTRTFFSPGLAARNDAFRGGLLSPPGRYYLCQAMGIRLKPKPDFLVANFDFSSGTFERAADVNFNVDTSPATLGRNVQANDQVSRVIVWENFGSLWPLPGMPSGIPPAMKPPQDDPILRALGEGWVRTNAIDVPVYQNFSWEWTYTARRREYLRSGTTRSLPLPTSQSTELEEVQPPTP